MGRGSSGDPENRTGVGRGSGGDPDSRTGVGRGRLYLTLHCHHQSDSCIKMGSDESRFNVRGATSRNQCPETSTIEGRGKSIAEDTCIVINICRL